MATDTPNPEKRARYDARVQWARERLDWVSHIARNAEAAYDKALKASASIDELDDSRFEREAAQVDVAQCQSDLDRLLDWRSYETGATR